MQSNGFWRELFIIEKPSNGKPANTANQSPKAPSGSKDKPNSKSSSK